MNDIQKKLNDFSAEIIKEANSGSKEILAAIENDRSRALSAAAAEIAQETARYLKAKFEEIKGLESRHISTTMMENRRQLFLLRGEFADEVFNLVREKIVDFTNSFQYFIQLKILLARGIDELKCNDVMEVFLRNEDVTLAEELAKSVSGTKLTFREGHFTLGGLLITCPANHITIDMTFDAALDDLVGHFAEIFGLGLD